MHAQKEPAITETDYSHSYKGAAIPYTIWSNGDGNSSVETIIFLGTVQVANLARWVAEGCPANTIVVQGAPHWFAFLNLPLAGFAYRFKPPPQTDQVKNDYRTLGY